MSGMNGNAETEPRRSIDGTEKAFTFSGVELTVFLSGSEIWSPASANGRETGRHQREIQVLMQWGNVAKNRKVKEWNAALRNLKISSYLRPNPQKNEKRQKTEFQSLKPLELRGVELYFLCTLSSYNRLLSACFPRNRVSERLLTYFYLGGRGAQMLTLHTERCPAEAVLTHALDISGKVAEAPISSQNAWEMVNVQGFRTS